MNLYKLHARPHELKHHDTARENVPVLLVKRYRYDPEKLKAYEHALAKDPKIAIEYTRNVLRKPFHLAEPLIAKSARDSYNYAVILSGYRFKGFKLGEPAISKDTDLAYGYARYVIEDRFELGEPAIAKDSYTSFAYAKYVLKGRFPLGEAVINDDPEYKQKYKNLCHYWDELA